MCFTHGSGSRLAFGTTAAENVEIKMGDRDYICNFEADLGAACSTFPNLAHAGFLFWSLSLNLLQHFSRFYVSSETVTKGFLRHHRLHNSFIHFFYVSKI